tara:strand:- start:637 stop:867 length:231 start_codon:yes stop_codon:yes gene_type:complete
MSDTFSHDIDETDESEPENLSVRELKENDLIEYRLNTMTISEVCNAASKWLTMTIADHSDAQIDALHEKLFNRELH